MASIFILNFNSLHQKIPTISVHFLTLYHQQNLSLSIYFINICISTSSETALPSPCNSSKSPKAPYPTPYLALTSRMDPDSWLSTKKFLHIGSLETQVFWKLNFMTVKLMGNISSLRAQPTRKISSKKVSKDLIHLSLGSSLYSVETNWKIIWTLSAQVFSGNPTQKTFLL